MELNLWGSASLKADLQVDNVCFVGRPLGRRPS